MQCGLPDKERREEIKDYLTQHFDTVRLGIAKLSGEMYPGTSKVSEPAADALIHHISAPTLVKTNMPVMIDRVLGPQATPEFKKLVGAVEVETALRYTKQAWANEVIKQSGLAADARDQAKQATTFGEKKKFLTEARDASRKASKAIELRDGVGTAIGMKESPFKTDQDYQNALNNQEVKQARQAYEQHFVPQSEEYYKKAEGIEIDDPITSITQDPNHPVSLVAIKEGKEQTPKIGTSAGRMGNTRAGRNVYANERKGNAEQYEFDMAKMMEHRMTKVVRAATKAESLRVSQSEGVGEWGRPGSGLTPYEITGVSPKPGTQAAKKGETSFFLKDKNAYNDMRDAYGDERRPTPTFLSRWLMRAAVASGQEFTFHGANLLTSVVKSGFINAIKALHKAFKGTQEFQNQLIELARIGAAKEPGAESGVLFGGKYDPTVYTSKFLGFLDKSMRVAMSDRFDQLVKRGDVPNTEKNRRDFINGALGQYNKKAQQGAVRWLRDTGIGDFATAGGAYYMEGLKRIILAPGVKTTGLGSDIRIRAEMLARVATAFVGAAVLNHMLHGNVLGDDDTPFGAVKTGTKDGKTQYFDLGRFTGLTRGLRETGLLAIMQGVRQGQRPERVIDNSANDIYHSIMHPATGPLVQFASTLVTGKDASGHKVATPKPGESNALANLNAALGGANPIYASLAGVGSEEGKEPPWSERIWDLFGPANPFKTVQTSQVVRNYNDIFETMTKQRAEARQHGVVFADEATYRHMSLYNERIESLKQQLLGRRQIGGRVRIGEKPDSDRQAQIREQMDRLARQALGR